MNHAYEFNRENWKLALTKAQLSQFHLKTLCDMLYRPEKTNTLSFKLQTFMQKFNHSLPEIIQTETSSDNTTKFILKLSDGLKVETVLIPFYKKMTICLSTQVGCAMNCSFCYTGTQGFSRNLTCDEIVGQYLVVKNWLKEKEPTADNPNIVFMGQGEPLHNVNEVLASLKIFLDKDMLGLGRRQITLSTVGYLPGLKQLELFPPINFALSLHSPRHTERTKLIPVNTHFPLEKVLEELGKVTFQKNKILTIEYLLIENFNDSVAHAEELALLLKDKKVMINLISFNPFPGCSYKRPSDVSVENFKHMLVKHKLRVTIRRSKGQDILAACGQLNSKPAVH
ncbi:MAG: 23S rRNA (adenine(2503)-C(2))-methyltransferase RlmN [Bacteriovoracaceae bacterium]|nr:23S rRNA (adenine(2503)-C(2))-methyltransferase RlmN [Bacteriovoracaceae bacterium]